MHSLGINGELRGQPGNPGSPGRMVIKTECVCIDLENILCTYVAKRISGIKHLFFIVFG